LKISRIGAVALATVLLFSGCATSISLPVTAAAPVMARTLTVFAAASLKSTITELATEFEKANPGVTVALNFAGSADLVSQITEGAPADVAALADTKNMAKLTDASLVLGAPVLFASNTLEIAVPPGNPAGISSFQDLAKPGLRLVICAPAVPCGAAASVVAAGSGVTLAPVSEESAVSGVLGKVTSGEADAGLVYVTDIKSAGSKVLGVTFPESASAVNHYPIGALSTATQPELAAAFIALVTGASGQGVLAAAGFGTP
jgi:molybdate transport system substrate-binding protein